MDSRSVPQVPLQLTALAILSPQSVPLYIRSFTGKQDELRHYHLAHAAVDVIEERIVMTSTPAKPSDSYLGLLFCMEDMAFYGFQTASKIRMVLSVALVDASIKDADIVAVRPGAAKLPYQHSLLLTDPPDPSSPPSSHGQIFRAAHHLLLSAVHNPFLSLSPTFRAKPAPPPVLTAESTPEVQQPGRSAPAAQRTITYGQSGARMFAAGPDEIRPEWLKSSERFERGIGRLGELLSGARM